MKAWRFGVIGLVGAWVLGCSDPGAKKSYAESCHDSCVVQESLKCPAEADQTAVDCEEVCAEVARVFPKCTGQFQATMECAELRVASGWECTDKGPTPKASVCPSEQKALTSCAAK